MVGFCPCDMFPITFLHFKCHNIVPFSVHFLVIFASKNFRNLKKLDFVAG